MYFFLLQKWHYIPNFKEPVFGFADHFAPHLIIRTVTKQIVQLMLPLLQLQFLALVVAVKLVALRSYFSGSSCWWYPVYFASFWILL